MTFIFDTLLGIRSISSFVVGVLRLMNMKPLHAAVLYSKMEVMG